MSAAASTTIVVGMTLWATSRTGRQGRQNAEAVAKQTADHTEALVRQTAEHAETMAVDERQHKRLEESYVEMLQMVERAGQWVYPIYPSEGRETLRPELPGLYERVRSRR